MLRKFSRRRSTLCYQSLEQRQLLASVSFDSGEVVVVGSASDDIIRLVGSADFQSFTVRVDDSPELTETFPYEDVTKITVYAGDGNDRVFNTVVLDTFIYGGDGDDVLVGGFRNDLLSGGNGDDFLSGRHGDDSFNGGAGNDNMEGGSGDDRLYGFDGNDRLVGDIGNDLLVGGNGNDRVVGNSGDDLLNGNDGDDIISAGIGNDFVNGGLGIDVIIGVGGTNTLNGNEGNDRIFGGNGADTINGGSEDDTLAGGDGEDTIHGDSGADIIFGGAQRDSLRGGDGDDYIYGQQGDDSINGNDGNDFLFGNEGDDDFGVNGSGTDRINGGSGDQDDVFYLANQFELQVDRVGANYRVTDIRIDPAGPTVLTGIEGLNPFSTTNSLTGSLPIEETVARVVDRRVTVQPIVTANSNGSNAANGFGTAEQEAEIKRRVDRIYNQAGIDVQWLPTKQWNDTFANGAGSGDRNVSDFSRIFPRGDEAGIGSSNPSVIDLYFVSRVPGFGESSAFGHGGGRGFVGNSGVTISVGDGTTGTENGRDIVAELIGHEIGHNLGLAHSDVETLLSPRPTTQLLVQNQIDEARRSSLTRSI
ncbi:hypothetical protein OAG71_02930 [bacterium]|nr:hypothetical protein [bacterium]